MSGARVRSDSVADDNADEWSVERMLGGTVVPARHLAPRQDASMASDRAPWPAVPGAPSPRSPGADDERSRAAPEAAASMSTTAPRSCASDVPASADASGSGGHDSTASARERSSLSDAGPGEAGAADAAPFSDGSTRQCRICLDTAVELPDRFLSPCACKGTMKVRGALTPVRACVVPGPVARAVAACRLGAVV